MTFPLLVASVVVLFVGPLLILAVRRRSAALQGVDGFVVVSLCGLVLVTVLPHSVEAAGWVALLAAAVGVVVPMLLERWHHLRDPDTGHSQALAALALVGLSLHSMLDGVALAHGDGVRSELGWAVVVHQLPVGAAVWSRVRPRLATLVLVGMACVTIVGYALGESALGHLDRPGLGIFEAFLGGALLHVAAEPMIHAAGGARTRFAAGLGGVAGLGVVAILVAGGDGHGHDAADLGRAGETFLHLAFESAPALLLGFAGAALLQAFLPQHTARWLGTGGRVGQALRGMVFGLPLPLCSCGVLPTYRTLALAGAPAAAGLAFLIATPEIGLDAFFLSLSLLGPELAWLRLGAAAITALAVGVVLANIPGPTVRESAGRVPSAESRGARLAGGVRFAFGPLFDHTMPWVLLGLGIAALLEPALDPAWLGTLPTGLDVVSLALLGMPSYVCASGATPLVAVLMSNGLSPGAAIAFLLTGPATNLTTVGILSRLHGRRAAWTVVLFLVAVAIAVGLAVNLGGLGHLTVPPTTAEHEGRGLLQTASLGLMGALLLASLLRRGPRGLVAEILEPVETDGHGEGGPHHHDHAHA